MSDTIDNPRRRGQQAAAPVASSDWPLGDLEPEIIGLRATIGILGHLIQSPHQVEESEWCKVEDELIDYAKRIEALWKQAWDQCNAEEEKHKAELAAAKAEKAAPGSEDDVEAAEGLWVLVATVARIIVERCAETGRPVKPGPITIPKLDAEPEPQPERMRW